MTAQQPALAPAAPPAPAAAPAAPAAAAPQVTGAIADGVPIPLTGVPRTAQELADLRAKRTELSNQLESAVGRRNGIANKLRGADGADRAGLEQRLKVLDQRIIQLETDIAVTGQQVAAAPASLKGRFSTEQRGGGDFSQRGRAAVGSLFTLLVLAPLAISAARMIWRRANATPAADMESSQRLMRLEAAVDTIAIEVERVSEGQRFLTKLLADSNGLPHIQAQAAQLQTAELHLGQN